MRGTPVVLIPGLQSDHRSWQFQVAYLEGAGHRVIVPSGHHGATSIAEMAAIIAPQIPVPSHIVAWSMGGYIALQLLKDVPERFASLAMVATSAQPENTARTRERERAIALAEAEGIAAGHRANLTISCHDFDALAPALVADLSQMAQAIGLDAFKTQQRAIIARPDGRPTLKAYRGPLLIVVGSEDRVTPLEFSREMHALVPGSRLEIVPDAGHCAPFEKPETVNAILAAWIADCEGQEVAGRRRVQGSTT